MMLVAGSVSFAPSVAAQDLSTASGSPALACGLESYPAGADEYGHSATTGGLRRAFDAAIATARGPREWREADCLAEAYLTAVETETGPVRYQLGSLLDHVVRQLEAAGWKEGAEQWLADFIASNPKLGTSQLSSRITWRARLLIDLDRVDEARNILEALEATPEMASGHLSRDDVWQGLAKVAIAQKRPRDARRYFALIAEQARAYPTILKVDQLLDYATLLEQQDDPRAAEAEYMFLIESQTEFQQADQPNAAARLAMSRYADFLTRQKRPDQARFYRLPREIADAVEAKRPEEAKAKARELYAEARRLFQPGDPNYRRALQIFAAVIDNDENVYDLPPELRQCGPWPIPEPEPVASTMPAPMIVTRAPSGPPVEEKIYFQYSRRPVVEADLVGGFLSAVGDLVRYANGCALAGNPERGADLLNSLAAIGRARGYSPSDLQSFYTSEAQIRVALDDFSGAERAYLAAADSLVDRDHLSLFDAAKLFNEITNFYLSYGRYDQAEAHILRFLETDAIANYDEQNLRVARTKLLAIYVEQGKADKALALLRLLMPARPVIDENSTTETSYAFMDWSYYYAEYGRILNVAGRHAEAAEAMKAEEEAIIADLKALQARGVTVYGFGARRAVKALYEPLGDAYAALGLHAEATDAYQEGVAAELGDLSEIASPEDLAPHAYSLIASFAQSAERAGRPDLADRAIATATKIETLLQRPEEESRAKLLSVSVARGLVDPAKRAQALTDGASLAKALDRQWLLAQQSGIETTSQQRKLRAMPDYYGRYASLLWRDAEARKAAPPTGEALRLLQRASLTGIDLSLGASVARAVLARDKPALVPLIDEREELGNKLERQTSGLGETVLRQEYRAIDAKRSRDVGEIVARIQDIDRTLAAQAPDYLAFRGGELLTDGALRDLARPGEAIVMLVPTIDGTHAIVATRERVDWRLLPVDKAAIELAVRRLLWFAGGDVQPTIGELNSWPDAVDGGTNGFDRDTAFTLYNRLIAPLLPQIGDKSHLVIAGSGALSSLPFGMLVTRAPEGRDDSPADLRATGWFADRFALVQVPSLQSLSLLRRYADRPTIDGMGRFIGFGDPLLDGEPAARGGRGAQRSSEAPIFTRADVGSALLVDQAKLRAMRRLPGTREEISALAGVFGAGDSQVYLGAEATEQRVRSMDLSSGNVIAFATHGVTADRANSFSEPGLVLTPPGSASAADDGYLTASEVAGLRLNADWVMLSACDTAAGDGSAGASGMSGLAKAFFYAGARNLLASHWPVRDDVAARLTVAIVETARDHPDMSRAEAFQAAMAAIRNNREHDGVIEDKAGNPVEQSWAHPNAWAPFSLIGQGVR